MAEKTIIEDVILRGLICDEDFTSAVIPHIKPEYFAGHHHKVIFNAIQKYTDEYKKLPTIEAIDIAIGNMKTLSQREFEDISTKLVEMKNEKDTPINRDWLKAEAEKWCRLRSITLAVHDCIHILEDTDSSSPDAMPDILKEALAVSFDQSVGHDFLEDAEERYDFYNKSVERLEFALDYFNKITGGGIPKKTLNILMGGTGGFKSGTMCSFAADYLMNGKNVLYITLELAEERVAERIDANLLDTTLDNLGSLSKAEYLRKINELKSQTTGTLKIKEYPTAAANVGHFRSLLRELDLKDGFHPDVIMVDYINIMTSIRTTMASGSYSYVKAIAEELRGLAVEFDVPIWSATQTNRNGFADSDVGLENTSESFGLPATADLFLALIVNEELEDMGQIMVKQLKNRYGDINRYNKFVVGKDGGKMKLFDVEDTAQDYFNRVSENKLSAKELKATEHDKPKFGDKSNMSDKRDKFSKLNFNDEG